MRRFLMCSGVDSNLRALVRLRRVVERRHPEGVLFAGGVLASTRCYSPQMATEWGLTREDAEFIERFFEVLGHLGVFSAVIPGPVDTPVEDFLRMGMHAEIEYPEVHLAHATIVQNKDVAISGVGGCICREAATDLDTCSRVMTEYYLRSLWSAEQPYKILLLPMPPPGPLGGEEGDEFAGELIDSYHPSLCVVGGPGKHRGVERIASTLVVNPGRLADGWAAWLDWNRPAEEQVEFLDLRHLEPTSAVANRGGR